MPQLWEQLSVRALKVIGLLCLCFSQPPTMKLHAIIEKTALFVSQHGAQMEILVKTKQAGNPQFSFLSFDHPLNVYYRFLVEQIKCGTYIPVEESTGEWVKVVEGTFRAFSCEPLKAGT